MSRGATTDREPAIYGLKFQARCITAVAAERERSRFLAGTTSLKDENELHLMEYDAGSNELNCERIFTHAHEVWGVETCPGDAALVSTVYNTGAEFRASVWRMAGEEDADASALDRQFDLDGVAGVRRVIWDPSEELGADAARLLSLDEAAVRVWDVASQKSTVAMESGKLGTAAWSPHNRNQVAVTVEGAIRGVDLRDAKKTVFAIEHAHAQCVRDLDFNQNRQYFFVSGGDDSNVNFWDLRKCAEPLKTLNNHQHWVTGVSYNAFHDQLVVSCGTDASVNLFNVTSLSSAPLAELDDEDQGAGGSAPADSLIKTYDEHEDSVYGAVWSCSETDAWLFATLSYDGRVVINHVPASEKYRILL